MNFRTIPALLPGGSPALAPARVQPYRHAPVITRTFPNLCEIPEAVLIYIN
jgi:hypothetical protein